MFKHFYPAMGLMLCCAVIATKAAADSKILATSGATQIEGSAGGGIVPWALISGYGDPGEAGGALTVTRVSVDDFQLDTRSLSLGIDNRLEISFAHQNLDVEPLNLHIRQDVIGAKLRLAGDVIYNQLPQISLGVQYKENKDPTIPFLVGADKDNGTDLYLSATKVYLSALLGRNLLVNGTLRMTQANQTGLLGFDDDYSVAAEISTALFINRHLALGAEYRQKPDNLAAVKEDDWSDVFVAWFPNKQVSLVLARAELGDIAGLTDQSGWYLSLQLSH